MKDPGLILSGWAERTTDLYTKDPRLILIGWADSTTALYTKDPELILAGWVDYYCFEAITKLYNLLFIEGVLFITFVSSPSQRMHMLQQ
jgi:hypothetical protein